MGIEREENQSIENDPSILYYEDIKYQLGAQTVRSLYGAPPKGYEPPQLIGPSMDTAIPNVPETTITD